MNPQKDWKAKLERAHFFKVRSDRITVWCGTFRWYLQVVQLGPSMMWFFYACGSCSICRFSKNSAWLAQNLTLLRSIGRFFTCQIVHKCSICALLFCTYWPVLMGFMSTQLHSARMLQPAACILLFLSLLAYLAAALIYFQKKICPLKNKQKSPQKLPIIPPVFSPASFCFVKLRQF